MCLFIRKLEIKYLIYRSRFKAANPQYTRGQWYFKIFMLGLVAVAYQFVGYKLHDIELNLYYGRIVSYGLDYVFLMGTQGLLLGLAVWRLLEVYWWAKNKVKDPAEF